MMRVTLHVKLVLILASNASTSDPCGGEVRSSAECKKNESKTKSNKLSRWNEAVHKQVREY